MPRRKKITVKLTKDARVFLLEKMTEYPGRTVAQVCREFPENVPSAGSIYRKSKLDANFAEELDDAYAVLYMMQEAELNRLGTVTATQEYPEAEFREAEAALKRRVDVLKYNLKVLAPLSTKRYEAKVQKTSIEHKNAPTINVLNYTEKKVAETGNVIEYQEDTDKK